MRRYCIFLVCILFHYIARAQGANYEYCYWFDSNIEEKQTGMTDAARWNLQIDVGHLSVALHQLHIQVRDTAGHWSVPYSSYFLKVTSDQSNTLAARYWFDDGAAVETTVTNGVQDIDVSALSPGMHYLHYQVQRADGGYSAVSTAMFLCTIEHEKTLGARYWFDDGAAVDTTVTNGVHDIDVSALSPGLHYLHYQVQRADGGYSAVSTAMFLCTIEHEKTLGARYWFDDGAAIDTTVTNGVQDIDVSALSPGLHYLHYQVQRADGGYSAVSTAMFLCTMEQEKTLGARYWFDDGAAIDTTVTNGVQDIDVSALSPGLHYLHYQVQRADGGYSAVNTAMFVKNRNGGDIVRYDYWVNNDTESLRIKAAQPGDSVYILNDSLDVASYPIHPDAFHFEVTDGIPYIYGKNELHARFYNSSNAFAEDSAMYIDGGSRREVTGILPLHHNSHRTDATPAADSIRWYRLEAYADNRISILVSQPSTVQLFSPEGKELLMASGAAVTDTLNCYAASEGTYYIALHSAIGGDSLTTIEYIRGNSQQFRIEYIVDGELHAIDSVALGDNIVALDEPTKENRTFSGWRGLPAVMPANDVTAEGSFAYQLDYMVEDTLFCRADYFYGDTIESISEPEKIWYLFEGWDGLPDVMPSRDLSTTARFVFLYELGDVNGDDRISVSDITVLTNHIMKLPNTTFIRDAADLNGDGRISVVDVTMTTNKILIDEE